MTDEEKLIDSYKRYINHIEQQIDDYYRLDDSDDSFYKDEIEQRELSLMLLRKVLKLIQKQESIIKNACYIIKKTNKQFKDFDDTKLNEYLYNFDKCATIREE